MTIAKIIAPVTGSARDSLVLATAFAAAKPFNAHVIALFVHPDPWLAVPYTGVPLSATVTQTLIDDAAMLAEKAGKRARLTFHQQAEVAGVKVLGKPAHVAAVSASFREAQGFFPHLVASAAQLADLVVFGPVSPQAGSDINEAFVGTLTKMDRPVLIADDVPGRMLCNVSIAWDGSIAAAHAVTAALPFLKHAERIDILTVHSLSGDVHDMREVSEYLALHGLACTEHKIRSQGESIAHDIMEHAQQRNSDLLVMGGYGHSHLRETLFGGVTSDVRWHPVVPTLMMH